VDESKHKVRLLVRLHTGKGHRVTLNSEHTLADLRWEVTCALAEEKIFLTRVRLLLGGKELSEDLEGSSLADLALNNSTVHQVV
jgi:hypothetical protein